MEIERERERGYTVDVKVFFSFFFSFGFLYFQNKSISDSFWFGSLFFCLFLHLYSLYIQARYEGYEFPNFSVY